MQIKTNCIIFKQPFLRYLAIIGFISLLVACSGPVYKAKYQGNSSPSSNNAVLRKARALLGKPYHYGGNTPSTGFDCSGFVQYTHAAAGIDLPRTTYQQLRATHRINRQQLRPGDLVFFRINRKRFVSHVGIYLGNSKFIHSPSSGKQVSIASLNNPYWKKAYTSAGRVF